MLRRLSLRDVAIVAALEVELGPGFTVLTGETGAGKSILIDALQLARGSRADVTIVREGAARAEVILGRHDAALARLANVDLEGYGALRDELRGDAFAAQGKRDDARNAYQSALTGTDVASPTRVLLELKLADAGGSTTPEA